MGERRPETEPERDERTGRMAARERARNQHRWVDLQIQRAMERGEFDDLPGAGKPLRLPDRHDPDWWVKQLIERERITGVAPEAILLRTDDARLDEELDREATEDAVRRQVEAFNRRVVEARRQLTGGPPVVTATRDPDEEVRRWRERLLRRRASSAPPQSQPENPTPSRRWWRRS